MSQQPYELIVTFPFTEQLGGGAFRTRNPGDHIKDADEITMLMDSPHSNRFVKIFAPEKPEPAKVEALAKPASAVSSKPAQPPSAS